MNDDIEIHTDATVQTLTLNRPASRNALTFDVIGRLKSAFLAASENDAVRVVVLSGEGAAFCSGLDLRQGPPGAPDQIEPIMRDLFHGTIAAIDRCPKPTIAFVDGPAAGFGVSLALACDLRIATDRAQFSVSFARIGLCPDGGSTWFLPRLVGLGKSLEIMLLGERVNATEALRIGLVERVVPFDSAKGQVSELAQRLAKGPPLVQTWIKRLSRQHLHCDLATALDGELATQLNAMRTRDFAEGATAFLQKRDPVFTGE